MKDKLLGWLFKSYARKLKEESTSVLELQMQAFKATLDVKDLIRERLKGVRTNHPGDDTILANHIATLDDTARLSFLSKAHDVIENPTFKMVALSLIVESEHDAMLNASDMVSVNFNRASVNGIMLIEDEMELLDKQYKEEQEQAKKMTDAERLSAL